MESENTPKSTNELLNAMADGELDLRENPEALSQIAQDAQAAQRVACQQQLRQAVGKAMDGPEMKCPAALADKLQAIAGDTSGSETHRNIDAGAMNAGDATRSSAPALYNGPSVVGRIGRWIPAAVAAVLLIAAGVTFTMNSGDGGIGSQQASFLPVDKLDHFAGRHGDCALNTGLLKETERFGDATQFSELPGKLADYFQTSTDGMHLSLDGIGYKYELTGACPLPGKGAVHVVYRHKADPDKAMSLWVMPAREEHASLKEGQVYSIASKDLMHPVIYWRQGGMLYYLVGDSLEDCDKAVKELRQTA